MTKAIAVLLLSILGLVLWTWTVASRAASRHPARGIFVPVTGGRLHLVDMGPRDAPPERTILLVHGASCNHLALTLPLAGPLLPAGTWP
jgi:hypothetical protein